MKFSVITATLNSGQFLEECIAAVVAQGPFVVEHIIVDGGSADETIAIAQRYPHLIVVERPGCSIYEAWNIGLDIATGDLVGICNSDDFYAPNTFVSAVRQLELHPEAWLVSGRSIQFRTDAAGNNVTLTESAQNTCGQWRFEDLDVFGPIINARFLARRLVDKIGKFDTRFRLASDCSYMMEIALARLPTVFVDEVFYHYRSHSGSSSLGNNIKNATIALEEKLRIGNELIASSRLQPRELGHLRRAMAVQFVSTIIECTRVKRWSAVLISLRSLHCVSFGERITLLGNACNVLWHVVVRRIVSPGRKTDTTKQAA